MGLAVADMPRMVAQRVLSRPPNLNGALTRRARADKARRRQRPAQVQVSADHHTVRLNSPEHRDVQDTKAFAYVRPHDLEVSRYTPGQQGGIVAQLTRAIVVVSTARLELQAQDCQGFDQDTILEAQLPAQHYRDQGFQEGGTLVLTPRKAKVFVAG